MADKAATLAAAAAVEKAGIAEHMDKAAKLIDEILEEIMRELFAEQVRVDLATISGPPPSCCHACRPELRTITKESGSATASLTLVDYQRQRARPSPIIHARDKGPASPPPQSPPPPPSCMQATAYISEESGEPMSEEDAVRSAVVQRIEFLDANFLAALNGYVQV